MSSKLNKNQIKRFSRQIILKNIGALGQKKIIQSKVLVIGMGGLGCPVAEFLTRAGVGTIGIIDSDRVDLSNIHRQSLYDIKDIKKTKVLAAKNKLEIINIFDKISIESEKKIPLPHEVRQWAISTMFDCADKWEIRFDDLFKTLLVPLGKNLLKESIRIQQVRDIFGIKAVDQIKTELELS